MTARLDVPPRSLAAILALVLGLLATATACTPRPSVATLDRLVFATPLPSFDRWWRAEHARAQRVSLATVDEWIATSSARLDATGARSRPSDISTDLCSFATDRGPGFDFRLPCIRHDFAWRNLHRLGRKIPGVDTSARRVAANQQFLRDLRSTCAGRPAPQRPACGAVARIYFSVVSAVT